MLSSVLLAATQLLSAAESMLRQRHFPEASNTRLLASALYSLYTALGNSDRANYTSVDDVRVRLRKAADDLLDTLD